MAPLHLILALEAATPAEPSWATGILAPLAGAAAIMLAGLVLLAARRRRSAADAVDQRRATEATERVVSAALTRRTINRGRLRLDDEVLSVRAPAADPADGASRSSI